MKLVAFALILFACVASGFGQSVVLGSLTNPQSVELDSGEYVRIEWNLERPIEGFTAFTVIIDSASGVTNTLGATDKLTAYLISGDKLKRPITFLDGTTDETFPATSDSVMLYSSEQVPTSYHSAMEKHQIPLCVGNVITMGLKYTGTSSTDKLNFIPIIITH